MKPNRRRRFTYRSTKSTEEVAHPTYLSPDWELLMGARGGCTMDRPPMSSQEQPDSSNVNLEYIAADDTV